MLKLGLWQGPVSSRCLSLLGFSLQQALMETDGFVAAEALMGCQPYPFSQSTAYIGNSAKGGFSMWKRPKFFYLMPHTDLQCFFFSARLSVPPCAGLVTHTEAHVL